MVVAMIKFVSYRNALIIVWVGHGEGMLYVIPGHLSGVEFGGFVTRAAARGEVM